MLNNIHNVTYIWCKHVYSCETVNHKVGIFGQIQKSILYIYDLDVKI